MKVSDFIIELLVHKKIHYVFGYPGGSVLHILNSIYTNGQVKYIQLYHEQSAAFAADAYARVAQTSGAALATSGPGATNLLTGVANAYFDSVPSIFITGQVSQRSMKQQPVRQRGFQEIDIAAMARPVTKYAKTFASVEEIYNELPKAMLCAESGRPGPVLLDLPHNLQSADIPDRQAQTFLNSNRHSIEPSICDIAANDLDRVCAWLSKAKRPLVLAGGGVAAQKSRPLLADFVDFFDLPVVASLMGLAALPNDHPLYSGFIGSYGHRYANFCLANADLLIVLGSRLDERQVGNVPELFASKARIVHVDIDPYELNHRVKADLSLCCEASVFMKKVLAAFKGPKPAHDAWKQQIKIWKNNYPAIGISRVQPHPNQALALVDKMLAPDAIVCLDVGQNQMWAAQSISFSGSRQLISSSGHGAMGYALPASIGASYAARGRQVICIVGDGGFQMNLQELQTVARDALPIKIFLLNNNSLGMIREFQERSFEGNCIGSVNGYSTPCFEKIAEAYGIPYTKIVSLTDIEHIEKNITGLSPHLFEIHVPTTAPLEPYPRPYRPVEDQLPELSSKELDEMYAVGKPTCNK